MTVTINLPSELQSQAAAQAQANGLALEEYLPALIAQALPHPGESILLRDHDLSEFESDMDALAEGSENWPVLPPEDFSRDRIYEDQT